eukprot:3765212-Rhodomonas_salina.1
MGNCVPVYPRGQAGPELQDLPQTVPVGKWLPRQFTRIRTPKLNTVFYVCDNVERAFQFLHPGTVVVKIQRFERNQYGSLSRPSHPGFSRWPIQQQWCCEPCSLKEVVALHGREGSWGEGSCGGEQRETLSRCLSTTRGKGW